MLSLRQTSSPHPPSIHFSSVSPHPTRSSYARSGPVLNPRKLYNSSLVKHLFSPPPRAVDSVLKMAAACYQNNLFQGGEAEAAAQGLRLRGGSDAFPRLFSPWAATNRGRESHAAAPSPFLSTQKTGRKVNGGGLGGWQRGRGREEERRRLAREGPPPNPHRFALLLTPLSSSRGF